MENETHWKYLERDGSWLYAIPKIVNFLLSCPNKIDQHRVLEEVGVLHIAYECVGLTRTVTIRNEARIIVQEHYVYHAEIPLQIEQIYPELLDSPEE